MATRSVCNEFNFACILGEFQLQREEIRVRGRVESRLHVWLRGHDFWRVDLGVLGRRGLFAARIANTYRSGGSGGEERSDGAVGYCD